MKTESLATLALKMMLTVTQTVALPSVITKAAESAGWTEDKMVAECFVNDPVRCYLAGICRTVAAKAF